MFKFSILFFFKEIFFCEGKKMKTFMKYWGIGTIFSTMESSKLINCQTWNGQNHHALSSYWNLSIVAYERFWHKLNYFLFCPNFEKNIFYLCWNFNNYYKIKIWSTSIVEFIFFCLCWNFNNYYKIKIWSTLIVEFFFFLFVLKF